MIRARLVALPTAALLLCLAAAANADPPTRAPKQAKALPAKSAAAPQADAGRDSMAAAMQRIATPGPQHAELAKSTGQWKATVKSWFGPGEPVVSEGVSQNAMILGGRYLEQRFEGSMMGQPFHGYGLTGYDNASGRWWSTWIDDMSTGVTVSDGTWDEGSKTMTMKAMMNGPDGKPMPMRTEWKMVDDNTQVFSMYGDMNGSEAKMMEITYKRM